MGGRGNATFIHGQTLAGQVRFTSTELGGLEAKIASAAERALGMELEIFDRLAAQAVTAAEDIKAAAEALAAIDLAAGLAALAVERRYGPAGVGRSRAFVIRGGPPPVGGPAPPPARPPPPLPVIVPSPPP